MEMTLDILAERLNELKDGNKEAHDAIRKELEKVSVDHEKRITALEHWQIGFVAKFSAYTAIAIFAGTMVAQLIINYINKFVR